MSSGAIFINTEWIVFPMKSPIKCLIIFIIAITSLINVAEKPLIKLGYADACPHMCVGGNKPGFTAEISQTIFKDYGYKVELVALPWARVVQNTNSGVLHGALSTGKGESPLLLYPEMELATQTDCFYGLKSDSWKPQGITSFKGRKSIIFRGWVFDIPYKKILGKDYQRYFEELSIDKTYTDRAIELVERGRMDAFWSDATVYSYYLSKKQLKEHPTIKQLGCVHKQNLYLGFSPKHSKLAKTLMPLFDKGMKEIRKDGRLDMILKRYGLIDWHK